MASTDKLTARQQEILDWIGEFIDEHGIPPTVREIGRAFDIKSSSVFDHLQALERKGHLRRGDLGARHLTLTEERQDTGREEVPVIGRIAAGRPFEAVEGDLGSIPLNGSVLRGEEGFALRVEGDSMVDVGIHDGDYVIVRKQETAASGDIVVGLIGDEATLKRFYPEAGGVRLEAANGDMEPIHVTQGEFRIQGKVVAVHRVMED